jgi:predicted metal-dependent phosphoesterase TrpH
MKIDLHCHSKYSPDSYLEPRAIIDQAVSKGLDGICLTEHYSISASLPVEAMDIPEGFQVFRGVEISTACGHLLVYGLRDDSWNVWSRNHYLDVDQVIGNVHDSGGICAAAHPFRGHESFGEAVFSVENLDAVETHNGNDSPEKIRKASLAAQKRNLPSIGGSDCHSGVHVGRAYTEFKNEVHSMEDLVREIKRGNCRGRVNDAEPASG